ncbi:MAG: orotidine-5'-phosphate decarboxylase [Gemmatimonadales bacterium]|nr:orotidine-5'-phosphate decarboxylase [Gemmatimonadales bacterium]
MAEIAVALDLRDSAAVLGMVDALGADATWYKVGPVLLVSDGPAIVKELVARGKRVFLDLKWHDIPNTVAGAVAAAGAIGAALATVHLAGGARMLAAAAEARRGGLRLVGVGILTSLGGPEYAEVVGRPVTDLAAEQRRLVEHGLGAGLDGFVTAASEAPTVRGLAGPGALLVVPGIRRAADAPDDQRRVTTPGEAVRAGADLLVVGRPITGAPDPRAALRAIREEMDR